MKHKKIEIRKDNAFFPMGMENKSRYVSIVTSQGAPEMLSGIPCAILVSV